MMYKGRRKTMPEILIELRKENSELRQAISARSFREGETVAGPDLLDRNLFTLVNGRVQLMRVGANGRRLAIATLGPGAMFGEGALLAGEDHFVRAVALTDCVVWVMPASQAQGLALRYPALSWGLLQMVGERLTQVEDRLEEVAYKRLPARLAGMLLELADGGHIVRGTSHQALADMLGTYRETISAILRNFKENGWVKLGYRRIELCDLPGLQLAASGSE